MERKVARRLRAGVVGGGIGKSHMDALRRLPDFFEIAAFCDIDAERAANVAAEYNVPTTMTAYDDLLALPDLDVVHICTPSSLHAAQAAAALKAGKDVICEKPLAGSLAEVDALAALAEETGRRLSPIYQCRFGVGLQKFLLLKSRNLLGKLFIATVETHWRRGPDYYAVPWRGRLATELGGCLISHAIHAHDLLTCALGPIASVHARTATRVVPIETEDCAVVSLEMQDGGLAALSVTLGAAVQHTRIRLCFENATIESNTDPYAPDRDPWTFIAKDAAAEAEIEAALADFVPTPEHYVGQFAGIHAALTTGRPLPVTIADARQSIELLTAAYYAAETGEAVALPIGTDHPFYDGWDKTGQL